MPLLVAEPAHALQVLPGGRDDAGLAEHGLQHDGHRLVGDGGAQRFEVVEGDVGEAGRHGVEGLLVVPVARGGDGGQGAPVEGVPGGDDLEGAVAMQLAPLAGELDGALVGLGAAVGEEDPVEDGVVDQQPGQLELGDGVVEVRGVDQGGHLLLDGLDQRRAGSGRGR